MKKIILILSATIYFITNSAFAMEELNENRFYIKALGGYSKFDKIHGFKSGNAGFVGLGAGYYVKDNIRTDLVLEHFIDINHKGTRVRGGVQRNHKTKGKIDALTLNGYVDLFESNIANLFVGAGIGAARVEAKNTFLNTRTGNSRTAKYKVKTNFTFALHAGVSVEIAPKIKGDIFYSYKDFGKSKKNVAGRKIEYRAHNAGVGLRFDI